MNLTTTGRTFYAIALFAFGIQQCIYGKIIAGRPFTWPASLPGQQLVAYGTGVLLIFAGVFIFFRKRNQSALIIAGLFILSWCAVRNLVETIAEQDVGYLLTITGKALVLGSGAFLVLGTFVNEDGSRARAYSFFKELDFLCRYCMGVFLCASGIQHFMYVDFVKLLIPAWIPGNGFLVYATGVLLILSGLSLLAGFKIRLTGIIMGGVILTWFFLVHLPRALGDLNNQNEMTAAFEALAFSGLLFLISGRQKNEKSSGQKRMI